MNKWLTNINYHGKRANVEYKPNQDTTKSKLEEQPTRQELCARRALLKALTIFFARDS